MLPTLASVTETPVSVTLPVLGTTKAYGIGEPSVVPLGVPACLSNVSRGADGTRVSTESEPDRG